ncbi:MAG: putative DNA binding domain-containing protein [Clostridiales bacterium]|nr:putative DNA binding domain-containing protein [Clostridiales bacterium]MDD7035658.1 ATP-binding protein [Bacillota bacterium]MDY2920694.1 ATP-binding protein [Lentihominibacter sp.]
MTTDELRELLKSIQKNKCESQTLELKRAELECPKRLYDTLSSFSNQDMGGIIVFGIYEENDYEEVGVYDPQDIQKKINEQCLQMEPKIRPLITVLEKDNKFFVSVEIPGIDVADRPCFYRGKGRVRGSYTRVGDSDEPMTEYEVYSYEAFRKKYQDDIRTIPRVSFNSLNKEALGKYVSKLKEGKPHLAGLPDDIICELMSITRNKEVTLASTLLFSPYPQAYAPQLCITALSIPGTEKGSIGETGERFIDNERIEGTIPEMLEQAISFVRKNMKKRTIINSETGKREDKTDYPITAVREAVLNALVHRDYSIHTEGMPITLDMYEDRIEISNPGGLYGRIRVDQLGKVQPDTRNPVIVTALEVLDITENRYSGIPTIRQELKNYGLEEPEFIDRGGHFTTIFHKAKSSPSKVEESTDETSKNLIEFCAVPRSRAEITSYLGLESQSYAITRYVTPLVEAGVVKLTIPDKPRSSKQKYYSEQAGGRL